MDDGAKTMAPNGSSGAPRPSGKSGGKADRGPKVFIDAQYRFHLDPPLRFRGATARLDPEGEPVLDAIARILRENAEVRRVLIRVHFDRSLAPDAAAALTQKQADAVRDALVRRGVAAERLVPTGVGSREAVVPNGETSAPIASRRVELVVEKPG